MSQIAVKAQRDFLTSLANVRPVLALSELIWNGFDATCSRVNVSIDMNGLDTMKAIRVSDDGHGISHDDVELLFGNLGASWKLGKPKNNGRMLHGKNGKGRFRAFGLGSYVTWTTVYEKDGRRYKYIITGRRDALDSFSLSEPVEVHGVATGTEVCIDNLDHHFVSLLGEDAVGEFAKQFAFYLEEYPKLVLDYCGTMINPLAVQSDRSDYPLLQGRVVRYQGQVRDGR